MTIINIVLCIISLCILQVPGATVLSTLQQREGRIVGGEETTIKRFPYQASLQVNGNHVCGAAIISATHLLTAAHCVPQKSSARNVYTIRAGSTLHTQGGIVVRVANIVPHSRYNQPTALNNDIALLVLAEPLTFSNLIQPIAIANNGDLRSMGPIASLIVSGWGAIASNSVKMSPALRAVGVHEINTGRCVNAYQNIATVTTNMICAGADMGGRDSCQGDSGGPLAIITPKGAPKLVGIVSFGIGCAAARFPGVYTKVPEYEDWLRQMLKGLGSTNKP